MNRYAGCVILYSASNEVVKNMKSYIKDIDCLYVINNDEKENKVIAEYCKSSDKIKYSNLKKNYGLAYALNYSCYLAIEDGFDYILTMDQDSIFKEGSVTVLKDYVENSQEEFAIVGSNAYAMYFDRNANMEKLSFVEIQKDTMYDWIMTSGSLMNLKAFSKTEGFDSDMFIAHVDIDIGIQFRKLGYRIIKLKDAVLYQHFGNSVPKKLLFWTVHPSFDSPVRMYYLFRNQAYLKNKFPKEKNMIHIKLYKYAFKILLFENKKIQKLVMAIKGNIDGHRCHMGKYNG